jgi:hypothetical protein
MNNLERLRELDKIGTPGEWYVGTVDDHGPYERVFETDSISGENVYAKVKVKNEDKNAELIVLMRNMLPLFLELVDAAEGFVFDENGRLLGHYKDDEIKMFKALSMLVVTNE